MTLSDQIQKAIREVPNFPIEGVNFKDVSTLFLQPHLIAACSEKLIETWKNKGITKILGIDSRGFLFAPQLAVGLDAGMVMVRKKGKIPPKTISISYELEYGSATIEVYAEAIQAGDKVLIHDDLLATGGTALAAAKLAQELGAEVVGFSFVLELAFLHGRSRLQSISSNIEVLTVYS